MSDIDDIEQRIDDLEPDEEDDLPPMIVYRDEERGQYYDHSGELLTDEEVRQAIVVLEFPPDEWDKHLADDAAPPGGAP